MVPMISSPFRGQPVVMSPTRDDEPKLGIVIPAFNEEDNVPALLAELVATLDAAGHTFEILVVDDGSADRTAQAIRDFARRDPRVRGLVLTRNFGHQAAISTGLRHVRGDTVVVMDADMQDRPADALRLYEECRAQSAEVAYAIRGSRAEGPFKRGAYFLFYRMLAKLARIDIPLDSGDFSAMSRVSISRLNALPERLRFVRGLRSWIGGKQIGVLVERDARRAGEPKYGFAKLVRLALDGLVSFSDAPLRVASVAGFVVAGLSVVGMIIVLLWRATGRLPSGAGLATIALSILFLGGVQLVTAGILGEYVGRIFEEVKARPVALIGEQIGAAPARVSATPYSQDAERFILR
jgi:dolichol-phosphate mannosyltransferase